MTITYFVIQYLQYFGMTVAGSLAPRGARAVIIYLARINRKSFVPVYLNRRQPDMYFTAINC